MRKSGMILIVGFFFFWSTANADTIINIDGRINNSSNPLVVAFGAGIFTLDPIGTADGGAYNATDACYYSTNTRWMWYYEIESNEIGPIGVGSITKYWTAMDALNNEAQSYSFNLKAPGNVSFYIPDGPDGSAWSSDNRGGVSLSVNSVPIPAAFWLFGSGLFGLLGIRRKMTS